MFLWDLWKKCDSIHEKQTLERSTCVFTPKNFRQKVMEKSNIDKILIHFPKQNPFFFIWNNFSWFGISLWLIWFQSQYSTLCLSPSGVLLTTLSRAAVGAVALPRLQPRPAGTLSMIHTEKLTGMFQQTDGSMLRVSHLITSCWLLLEFSLLAALRCRHTSTLTPSASNPFFPVWDQRSAARFLLLSIQIHFEGWSLLSMNIHSAFLKTPDFWKVSEKKSKVKNIFFKKQTPHEWEKRFCNLNPNFCSS